MIKVRLYVPLGTRLPSLPSSWWLLGCHHVTLVFWPSLCVASVCRSLISGSFVRVIALGRGSPVNLMTSSQGLGHSCKRSPPLGTGLGHEHVFGGLPFPT